MTELGDGFGHWLAGFIDGEGCFAIAATAPSRSGPRYQCRFLIGLRADDAPVLDQIRLGLGIGRMHWPAPPEGVNQSVEWRIQALDECLLLVGVLDRFPLRAKKAADFAIWREAVLELHHATDRIHRDAAHLRLALLKEALHASKRYAVGSQMVVPPSVPISQLALVE